jgi:DNA-directed RNA polymerase specialized sigma24 family protein
MALNIHKLSREQRAALEEVNRDTLMISAILQKVEIALHILQPIDRRIMELRFLERLTWNEVSKALSYDVRSVQRRSKEALERVTAIARIEISVFVRVKNLLEGM